MILLIAVLGGVALLAVYGWVRLEARPWLREDAAALPPVDTALVLGTAKLTRQGGQNPYFARRVAAAADLYRLGRVRRFILSGAGRGDGGGEASDMAQALEALGVPTSRLLVDNRSFRTWDSLRRCREVYGCHRAIVVSQRFHNERAVFAGRRRGMELWGFNAAPVGGAVAFRMFFRECLARVKCLADLLAASVFPR